MVGSVLLHLICIHSWQFLHKSFLWLFAIFLLQTLQGGVGASPVAWALRFFLIWRTEKKSLSSRDWKGMLSSAHDLQNEITLLLGSESYVLGSVLLHFMWILKLHDLHFIFLWVLANFTRMFRIPTFRFRVLIHRRMISDLYWGGW